MAAYFLISVLAIALVPLTLASLLSTSACVSTGILGMTDLNLQSAPRSAYAGASVRPASNAENGSAPTIQRRCSAPSSPRGPSFSVLPRHTAHRWLRYRALVLLVGWSLVAFLVYRVRNVVSDNKVYDPYDILGIATVRPSCYVPSYVLTPSHAGRHRKRNQIALQKAVENLVRTRHVRAYVARC